MNRKEKESVVTEFHEEFKKAHASFLVNYKGVAVVDMQALRRGLYGQDARLRVTKARLMKLAVDGVEGSGDLKDWCKDQVALVFAYGDVPAVAKSLVKYSSDHETFSIVGGFFEGKSITCEHIKALASLPSREVLLGMLIGTCQAPVVGLARVLNLVVIRLLLTLQALAKKQDKALTGEVSSE